MSLLQCSGLVRRYGGVIAVDDVSLDVQAGEIVGLIGPNGSGKSTLVDLMSGVTPSMAGTTVFGGEDVSKASPWRIARLGLARTFQMVRLFPHLSIHDNLVISESWRMETGFLAAAMRTVRAETEAAELSARAMSILAEFYLAGFADRYPGELSIGQQRMVEIARCLMGAPRLLLLDEPAAGLSPPNVDRLVDHIRRIRDERGTAILLVEHVMRVVMSCCDRVAVLDQGSKIADGPPAQVTADPAVIAAYLGVEEGMVDA